MKWIPALTLLFAAPFAAAQERKGPPDDVKVGEAIKKGVEWLKGKGQDFGNADDRNSRRELVLLTLIHSGISESDPFFAQAFKEMLQEKPRFTYRTALRAMVLEEVERVKYQPQIFHCAEFLVDNQSKEGYWGYGDAVTHTDIPPNPSSVASGRPRSGVIVFGEDSIAERKKPKIVRRVAVTKKKDGNHSDNSNSQYATLGLRACHDAGIVIPPKVIEEALDWWRKSQETEDAKKDKPVSTGTGVTAPPRGWGYKMANEDGGPRGSMTVGAVGGMAILLHMAGKNWKQDRDLAAGVAWIADNFSVTGNPKKGNDWHYYYLYGLERAGMLYDTPKFGAKDWYTEGAWYLIDNQKEGGWGSVENTCFAILFLRRATRALVESTDNSRRR